MHPDELIKARFFVCLLFPALGWMLAVKKTETLTDPKLLSAYQLIVETPSKPFLILGLVAGLILAILVSIMLGIDNRGVFRGAAYRKHYRGTKLVTPEKLKRMARNKKGKQVQICGIPIPIKVENLHLLVNGATGTGKSAALLALMFDIFKRGGDRTVILDPEGDAFSKFGREKDVILNPYDERGEGWSFFNEIRGDYDFQRFALSLIPRGQTDEAEEWASYGRLIVECVARKLHKRGDASVKRLFEWSTIAEPDSLRSFLEGTKAESLFSGSSEASRALTSARFVLSDKLSRHLDMPDGDFSIRAWLEDPNAGNLYITWREDQAESLKALISTWVDVVCTSVLSLPASKDRRLWLFIDELASLDKLASLVDGLTKGRKKGLRVVAGIQSVAQLDDIYGQKEAQVLRSCFRSLLVLGGTRADPATCEEMSRGLGEQEVSRDRYSRSHSRHTSRSTSDDRTRERVVMPSEIAQLPDLSGYIGFAGDYPVTYVKYEPITFKTRLAPFIERIAMDDEDGDGAPAYA